MKLIYFAKNAFQKNIYVVKILFNRAKICMKNYANKYKNLWRKKKNNKKKLIII